jgi:histone deacetylase complex regulatory component SIN3
MRQLFTKFRVSGHSLEIESGRYKNITREERICKKCNLNEIGDIDEYHFFLKCTANHSLRNNLFNKIILNKPDFIEEIPLNKIFFLLNANSELLTEVGDFIKQSTEL